MSDEPREQCKFYEVKKAMENKMNIPDYTATEFKNICNSVDDDKTEEIIYRYMSYLFFILGTTCAIGTLMHKMMLVGVAVLIGIMAIIVVHLLLPYIKEQSHTFRS